ncbi:hypothetical protein IF129_18230 [Streptomyces chumphonensis]|uniref:Uncharacterized protein n=1 Tax=Streptomyces chumphonensis TaxID=1214925 RepID=A0A927F3G6_9ACTN|nr:hypothetical protein [Streptomyces chumphonensis]MBD3933484.1 hypothetical protein [Streptomyces chumphonensis]
MNTEDTPRYVRLQVEVVLEVADPESLARAASEHIAADEFMPDEERRDAVTAVGGDTAEAIAYLVDPIDLVSEVPGVELAQASWSSELIDYDPESELWQLDGFEDAEPAAADR